MAFGVIDPLTWAEVLGSLPAGASVYQLTTNQNGKQVTTKAVPSDYQLQPGDAIEVVMADGSHILRHVNQRGDDLDNPVVIKAAPKAAQDKPDVRNFGTTANPDWRQYNQTSKTWEPLTGVGNAPKPAIDAKTQAMAESAAQKIRAGIKPTQAELAALNMVRDAAGVQGAPGGTAGSGGSGGNGYVFPLVGWHGTVSPHGAPDAIGGSDLMAPLGTPVVAMRGGKVLSAGWDTLGGNSVLIQGDDGNQYYYAHLHDTPLVSAGDMVATGQSLGIVGNTGNAAGGPTHLHIGIGPTISTGAGPHGGIGEGFDAVSLLKAAQSGGAVPPSGFGLGGVGTTNRYQHVTVGGKEYIFDPATGKLSDSGVGAPQKPDLLERNGKTYQYDPTTDAWLPVKGLPDDTSGNKALAAIQQQYDTITYIQQQLASGLMNPSDASAYLGAVKQQTAAALAGTTPFDIYKEDLTNRYQQAQVGRDILNNQMTATDNLVKTLMPDKTFGLAGNGSTGGTNPYGLAQAMVGEAGGDVGPQPVSATAKALIDLLNPSNPQPTIGSSTAAALGPSMPGGSLPVGPIPGTENDGPAAPPPLQPGTGPADNTLREAA